MKVHTGELSDVSRYLENKSVRTLKDEEAQFENYLTLITRFKPVNNSMRFLEIGIGTGWFPLLCASKGISCKGLEISQQLVDYAKELGRRYRLEPDIELGNIEENNIGVEQYDVIVAHSVFEHIEEWELALQKVADALKPGGVFLFSSTNKFSPRSGEYAFPLYGWLPDAWRYRLRMARQGPDIMKLGIDFNQFTYPQLRRAFRKVGFQQIHDRVDVANPSGWKRPIWKLCKQSQIVREIVLLFSDATVFVCMK